MFAIGVFDYQIFRRIVKGVHARGGVDNGIYTLPFEIAIAQWRGNKTRVGVPDAAIRVVKIKGYIPQPMDVIFQFGHIPILRPSSEISVFVVYVGIQSTTRYHNADARFKNSGINGIVPAQ